MKNKTKTETQSATPEASQEAVLLRQFIHNAPHPYLILEESGMVAGMNPAMAHLLQSSETDHIHTAFVNIISTVSRNGYFDLFRPFFNGTNKEPLRVLLKRGDGSSLPVSLFRHREMKTPEGIRQCIVAVRESIIEERIAERVATLTDQIERRAEEQIRFLESNLEKRERIEKAFRDSQERQALAFWGGDMGWWDYDIVADNIRFSSRISQMLGEKYATGPLSSSTLLAMIYKDDLEKTKQHFLAHFQEESSIVDLQVRMVSHSCAWKWVSLRGRITEFDKNKKPLRMIGVIQDINETKQTEQKQALFFNHASDMLAILGKDGIILQVNPAWQRILGWKLSELEGQPAISFTHPQDQEKGAEILHTLENGETPPLFEQRALCKDGSFRWLSCLLVPLPEYQISIGIARDVTEQKEQEDQNHRQKQYLEDLANESAVELKRQKAILAEAMAIGQIAHWEYDLATGEFIFNDAIYEILRTTVQREGGYRLKASVFQERFHIGQEKQSLAACMGNLPNVDIEHLRSFVVSIRFADNMAGYAMVRIRIEKDEAGNIIRIFGIAQDITTQKQMKAELQRQEHIYRNLFETSPAPVFVADAATGKLIDANERALRFVGLSIDEVRKMHFTQLHDDSSYEIVTTTFNSISKCKNVESVVAKIRHHSGAYRAVIIHTRAVACGEAVYAVGIMTDIKEHKRMLKQAENGGDAISTK